MSENEDRERLLAEFFKSLGKVDEESQKLKEYQESAITIVQWLFEFVASKLDFVKTRIYGSSVENLKNYSINDVGDIDLLLFLGDEGVVDESMLEYLPNNPAFVKIKGDGHPLFQSSLAEGTQYVSSSEVKELYPFVDAMLLGIKFIARVMSAMSGLFNSSVRERDAGSPALTFDFSTMRSSQYELSRGIEQFKRLNFQNLDPSELEFIPVVLSQFGRLDYTPQHAEAYNDFLQHVKDSLQSLCNNPWGILLGIPNFICDTWFSEKAKEIKNRFFRIKRESKIESGSEPEDNGATALEPQVIAVCKNVNKSSKCDHFQKSVSITDLEEINLQQASANEGMERRIRGKVDNNHDTTEVDIQENLELRDIEKTHQEQEMGFFNPMFEFLSEQEEGTNALFNWLLVEKMGDLLDYLGTLTPVQELEYLYTNNPEKSSMSASVDIVPALQARGWPKVAREWINRKRHWPSPEIVHTIIQEGFHLVVKPPKGGGCSDTIFRLSFSHAEYLLSQQLNDVQRKCYRGLKKYYSACLRTKPESLATYHLKTLFLQTCEETRVDMWTKENMPTCMMTLLANLHSALSEKYLRHLFIKECNLFDAENIENPHLLDSLAVKVEHFMRSPKDSSPELLPTRRPDIKLSSRYEQAPSNQEGQEGCIKGTLPSNPEGCGKLTAEIENEASASQEQWPTRTASTAKDVIRMHGTREPETDTLQGARFHDLKVIYTNTCAELLTIATEDCTGKQLDSLQRSLVEDIRELISEYDICPDTLMDLFQRCWSAVYLRMYLISEFFTKHSMLTSLRNNIKGIKHKIRRDGILGSPRDFSLIIPVDSLVNVYRRFERILRSMEPKQPTFKMEDIPLD